MKKNNDTILTDKQIKILKLRKEGLTQTEIAKIAENDQTECIFYRTGRMEEDRTGKKYVVICKDIRGTYRNYDKEEFYCR